MEGDSSKKRSPSPSDQDLRDLRYANKYLLGRLMERRVAALTVIRETLQQKVRTGEQEGKQAEQ
jgi:hypothetical protein